MKKYVKPNLELKVVAASKGIATAGLDGWLANNGLAEVNITTVQLYAANS